PTQIIKRTGEVVPFDRTKIVNAIYKAAASLGGHDRALSERLADEVTALAGGGSPSVEEIQDLVERVLIENGHARTAKAFILYRSERARLRRRQSGRAAGPDDVPYKAMWRAGGWRPRHGGPTGEGLNRHVRSGTFAALVQAAEKAYDAQVEEAARAILEARDRTRIVIIAGPSSSGKTTATCKMTETLRAGGLEVVPLNLDNYFFD